MPEETTQATDPVEESAEPTSSEGSMLDDALADGDAIERAMIGDDDEPSPDADPQPESQAAGEEPVEEPVEEPEGEAPEPDTGAIRYRDPDTGKFISEAKAREQGLEPEELETDEQLAADLFEGTDDEPEIEPVRLTVPADGDEEGFDLEVHVEDPDSRAAIENIQQRASRVDELEQELDQFETLAEEKATIAADRRELEQIEEELREDPSPFLLSHVPEKTRKQVVLDLIALDDDVHNAVVSQIDEWEVNPIARERDAARRQAELATRNAERTVGRITTQRVERTKEMISSAVDNAVSGLSDSRKKLAREDILLEIARYAQQQDAQDLTMEEVRKIPRVQLRLEQYELDIENLTPDRQNGAQRATDENGRRVVRGEPATDQEKKLLAKADEYEQLGRTLRKAHARRKAAAASTGPGAGSQPASAGPPKDATLEEAFDFAERRMGK